MALEAGDSFCSLYPPGGHSVAGGKFHQCPHCEYRSVRASHVVRHMKALHSRDLPYKCSGCSFSASYPLALKTHLSKVHGEVVDDGAIQSINPQRYCGGPAPYLFNLNVLPNNLYPNYPEQKDGFFNGNNCPSNDNDVDEEGSSDEDCPPSEKTDEDNRDNDEDISESDEEGGNPLVPQVDMVENPSGAEVIQLALNPFDYALPSGQDEAGGETGGECAEPRRRRRRRRNRSGPRIDKEYKCSQCSAIFNKSKHLKAHMKSEHGLQLFPCTQCDFTAPQSGLLKYHMQAVHKAAEGMYVLQCPQCPYCTVTPEKLQTHVRVKHDRIRPYKCPHCSYSSTQAGHIRIHVRAKHTNEKPFHCSYCSYQSAYASALKSHIVKRHTNN